MPQTRFVLQKALELNLKPIVVINKVDKPNCRPDEVHEQVFEVMMHLDATNEQLEFPVVYGSSKQGWMGPDWKTPTEDVAYLLDTILSYIPASPFQEGTPQMMITSLDYSSYGKDRGGEAPARHQSSSESAAPSPAASSQAAAPAMNAA